MPLWQTFGLRRAGTRKKTRLTFYFAEPFSINCNRHMRLRFRSFSVLISDALFPSQFRFNSLRKNGFAPGFGSGSVGHTG